MGGKLIGRLTIRLLRLLTKIVVLVNGNVRGDKDRDRKRRAELFFTVSKTIASTSANISDSPH